MKQEIQKVFVARDGVGRVFFPEKSSQIPDRPEITFIIGDLQHTMEDHAATVQWAEAMTKECGNSSRTFKSALIWVIAESESAYVGRSAQGTRVGGHRRRLR